MNLRTILPALLVISTFCSRLEAQELANVDFTEGDEGYTTVSTGSTTVGPWTYNAASGTWSVDGSETGTPTSHTLVSPAFTVPGAGDVPVSLMMEFTHRYSIEPEWDGLALQIGVNGGEFRTISNDDFLENGYTFSGLIGNHVLNGEDGFNGDSSGYSSGSFIVSVANLGAVRPGDEVQVAFLGAWDEGARGTSPNWEIDSLIVSVLEDSDGDGMFDDYEDANGLDKAVNDAEGDLDSDMTTNLAEFLQGTDPQDDDSDNDGLLDGVETATGEFVSSTDTGTDPLNPDSDADKLLDGVETGTNEFVSTMDTGSNPLLADTDGDGFSDGSEVAFDKSPVNPLELPDSWVVRNATSSSALNSIADCRELFAGQGLLEETITLEQTINFRDNADGVFTDGNSAFPVLGQEDAAADDYAILVNGTFFVDVAGTYTFGFNSDDGGGLYINGEPAVIVDANRGSTTTVDAIDLPFGNHRVEFIYWERGGGAQVELFVHDGVGDFTGEAFDAADYVLLESSFQISDDTDGDSLPDQWEINFFGNLTEVANGDPDSDGSSNAAELVAGTTPNNEDSDGDSLLDGVETDTGIFVNADDRGTDPLKVDSDDDGLSDGVETGTGVFVSANDTGSSPVDSDSDDDAVEDGREVAEGFDPNDSESKPDLPLIEIVGVGTDSLLGNDLTDPEDDGDPAAGEEDSSWNWVSIDSNDEPGFGGGEFSYNIFDNNLGGGNAKWCCTGASEEAPLQVTVEFDLPHLITHFTMSSANDVAARDPLDFEILGSNDGVDFTPIFTQSDDESLWTERLQVVRVNLPTPSAPYKFIRYEVTRTGNANHQLGEIEYFGFPGGDDPNLVALSAWNLGEQPSATVTEQTLALRNTGQVNALTLTEVRVTGADQDNFTLVSFPSELGILGSGSDTGELVISFDPGSTLGGFSAVIEFDTNDEGQPTISIPVSALVLNPLGPDAHYRLDESDGAEILIDASGFARNGTFVNGVATQGPGLTDTSATAVDFSGSYYGSVDGRAFDPFGSFSFSLWVQADEVSSGEIKVLFAKGTETTANFGLVQTGSSLGWLVEGGIVHQSDDGLLAAGTAQHVVAVHDGAASTLTFYVDGVAAFTQADPSLLEDSTETTLAIGAFINGALGFVGVLDDLQIYPRALSSDEVVFLQDNPGTVITPEPPVQGDVDSDGDGVSDELESLAGTDPNDASDYLRILNVLSEDDGFMIEWATAADKTYTIEYSVTLEDNSWISVATGENAGTYLDTDAARGAEGEGYYRVVVE